MAKLLFAGLWASERNAAVEQTLGSVSRVRAVSHANALVVAPLSEGYAMAASSVVAGLGLPDQVTQNAASSDLPSTAQPLVALARMRVQVLAEGAMFGWAAADRPGFDAAGFGVKVVAEGVGTGEQAAALRGLGCGYAQGWLVGGPMPSDDFELFVETSPDRISI